MFMIAPAVGGASNFQIKKSLRFNGVDSPSLYRTPASSSTAQKATFSCWVKRTTLGTGWTDNFIEARTGVSFPQWSIGLNNDTIFSQQYTTGGAQQYSFSSVAVFRDVGAWYHVVVAFDTTQAVASDRAKLWVNGVLQTITGSTPGQGLTLGLNLAITHTIGAAPANGVYSDFYLSEVYQIDGQTLTPSSFGKTDPVTGQWVARKYTGTYGTNGFYLPFDDGTSTTTLGYDRSGNNNNWTPSNLTRSAGVDDDWFEDTPTNNYCTINPLNKTSSTITNGSLQSSGTNLGFIGTQSMTSGKWYWEVNAGSNNTCIGICKNVSGDLNTLGATYLGNTPNSYGYAYNGSIPTKVNNGGQTAYGVLHGTSIISVLLDLDAGTLTFWTAGVSDGVAFSGLTGEFFPACSDAAHHNFGQRAFTYTPPAGYKTLCTKNLPNPTVKKSLRYFQAVTWTGTGTGATRSITGVGFSPDFVWAKNRTNATGHLLYDTSRGAGNNKELVSNSTVAEGGENPDVYDYLSSFDADGFTSTWSGSNTRAYFNLASNNYVAWNWKANGTAVANTDGTITSQVSANTAAGFSIVTYTGTGTTDATVGHGLGTAPKIYFLKSRNNVGNWAVAYTVVDGSLDFMYLNTSAAGGNATQPAPTSSVINVQNAAGDNALNSQIVAYCFAEVPGYSKFGTYVGNGQTDGTFVYCGFKPKFVMVKRVNTTGNWQMHDSARDLYNPEAGRVYANLANAENAAASFDFVSNGFKLRSVDTDVNTSGSTYLFVAFAEAPYKYSTAR